MNSLEQKLSLSSGKIVTGLRVSAVAALAALSVFAGIGVYVLARFVDPTLALGCLTALVVFLAGICTHLVIHRANLGVDEIEARLTLDQLQQGNTLWRIHTPYSATSAYLAAASRELLGLRHSATIVELGSGLSTMVLARIIRNQSVEAKLVSVEHDANYATIVREELRREGLVQYVTFCVCPLAPLQIESYSGPWYDLDTLPGEVERIDLLLVDGPPKRFASDIRYPALPVLGKRLAPGALVLLDDARRKSERKILERWRDQFPEATVTFEPGGHGIGVVRWSAGV